ncbi:MAG: hypothetical protein ABIG94_05900, partial [Pseudomonadota bacterium]
MPLTYVWPGKSGRWPAVPRPVGGRVAILEARSHVVEIDTQQRPVVLVADGEIDDASIQQGAFLRA